MSTHDLAANPPPAASPWHAGELAMQRSAGAEAKMDGIGRKVVRSFLLEQHRAFYPLLPYVALGTVDAEGHAWATLRAGRPGFLHAPTPLRLEVHAMRDPVDPAEAGMDDGMAIGLLGIDMATRRRNRLNGTVHRQDAKGFAIGVQQSFGNCPRYIQNRDVEFLRDPAMPSPLAAQTALDGHGLDARARQLIARADSLFVATYVDEAGQRQVDVSHRGGRSGFVRVDPDGTLTVPDFSGNLFFNTLGNMVQNPRTGLLFVDYESGDVLQLSGMAEVVLDAPEIGTFQGAERLWRFRVQKAVYRPEALPLRWTFRADGWSPSALLTGHWQQAEASVAAVPVQNTPGTARPLRLDL